MRALLVVTLSTLVATASPHREHGRFDTAIFAFARHVDDALAKVALLDPEQARLAAVRRMRALAEERARIEDRLRRPPHRPVDPCIENPLLCLE